MNIIRKAKFNIFRKLNSIIVQRMDRQVDLDLKFTSYNDINYDGKNTLDVLKLKSNEIKPIIMYFHGGGWAFGDKNLYTNYCKILASNDFVVFNINYTLSMELPHPAQIKDAVTSLNWVFNNGLNYGGDVNSIFVVGDSAGSHLAGMLGVIYSNEEIKNLYEDKYKLSIEKNIKISGIGFLCGVGNVEYCYNSKFPCSKEFCELFINSKDILNSKLLNETNIVKNIVPKFPSSFLCTLENDPMHKNSLELKDSLEKNEVQIKFLNFDKTHKDLWHSFQINQSFKESKECTKEMIAFFKSIIHNQ